jgi:hypothetical protein
MNNGINTIWDMKSYTDLEQSKKLSEFLSPESADMIWTYDFTINDINGINVKTNTFKPEENDILAWSLAALLNIIPKEISTGDEDHNKYQINVRFRYDKDKEINLHQIAYGNNKGSSGSWHDMVSTSEQKYLIDCCVEMIFWLRENNLLAI